MSLLFLLFGKEFDETKYKESGEWVKVSYEDCENCQNFKSKYIEFPIVVTLIESKPFNYKPLVDEIGTLVAVRPCNEKYQGKTYIGFLIGDIPVQPIISYDENNQELDINMFGNPCIFVPELKELIFGYQSWWTVIESEEDFKKNNQ